jgi:hypothetical protein
MRANPYFFRDQEDDEELLLTVEMNDSSANAHRPVPTVQHAAVTVSSQGSNSPYLGPTRNSDTNPATAQHAPNPEHAAEASPETIVESMVEPRPWPSINERRLGAPIPAREHGTGTPPRRSWWRRSIGHNS